jgi:VanZ family protein
LNALLSSVLFPPRWLRLVAVFAFVVVAANLFWHGAQPYSVGLVPAPWDKLAHVIAFGGFGGTAWVMLGGTRRVADVLAPLAAVGVGVADEFAQQFNPGRGVSGADIAADAIGAILVVMTLALLRERVRRGRLAAKTARV